MDLVYLFKRKRRIPHYGADFPSSVFICINAAVAEQGVCAKCSIKCLKRIILTKDKRPQGLGHTVLSTGKAGSRVSEKSGPAELRHGAGICRGAPLSGFETSHSMTQCPSCIFKGQRCTESFLPFPPPFPFSLIPLTSLSLALPH